MAHRHCHNPTSSAVAKILSQREARSLALAATQKTNNRAGCKSTAGMRSKKKERVLRRPFFKNVFSRNQGVQLVTPTLAAPPARPKEDPGPRQTLARSPSPSLLRLSTLRTHVARRLPCSKLSRLSVMHSDVGPTPQLLLNLDLDDPFWQTQYMQIKKNEKRFFFDETFVD